VARQRAGLRGAWVAASWRNFSSFALAYMNSIGESGAFRTFKVS
jgi:hypothetical protein